jgi:hypothetical protein
MEKHCLVLSKTIEGNLYDVSRSDQARLAMADSATPLSLGGPEPVIHQIEVVAAVIDFAVVISHRPPTAQNGQVLAPAVAHRRHGFRQMYRRVPIVTHTQQQNLSIELIDTTYRAVQSVRYVQRMLRSDVGGFRSDSGESMGTVAAKDARKPPKGVRHDSHSEAGHFPGNERMIVIVGHARHNKSASGPHGSLESVDQTMRPMFDGGHSRKRRVNEENPAGLHPKLAQLRGQFTMGDHRTAHRFSVRPPNDREKRRAGISSQPSTVAVTSRIG